jgi:hypothetical protein
MTSRRSVLAALGCLAALPRLAVAEEKKHIAAIVTEYRENSHADVIVTKFLEGCKVLDTDFQPQVRIASLFMDQEPANDLGRGLAEKHKVSVFPTIEAALTLGGEKLAVDGVLLIGEHGRYPYNELGQHLYPRRRFFEAAAGVMRKSGRSVPVFNDKHLEVAWADAKWMYDTARELKIPFMAGSSVPGSWRKPELKIPAGAELQEAVAIGYGGTEAYGFHTLEMLQCVAELRKGGETGVKSVQCLTGDAVWQAADQGRWSMDVMLAALSRSERPAVAAATLADVKAKTREPELFLVEYRDGFSAAVPLLHGLVDEFLFAVRTRGDARPASSLFWLQDGKPFGHFARLSQSIERMFLTGEPEWPVERTLLVTGILEAAMQSRFAKGKRIETPHLDVRYKPALS